MLSTRISDYPTITHGKTRIPGINDGEEFESVDVSSGDDSWFFDNTTCKFLSLVNTMKISFLLHK